MVTSVKYGQLEYFKYACKIMLPFNRQHHFSSSCVCSDWSQSSLGALTSLLVSVYGKTNVFQKQNEYKHHNNDR